MQDRLSRRFKVQTLAAIVYETNSTQRRRDAKTQRVLY
jgi:hypothetical protein